MVVTYFDAAEYSCLMHEISDKSSPGFHLPTIEKHVKTKSDYVRDVKYFCVMIGTAT